MNETKQLKTRVALLATSGTVSGRDYPLISATSHTGCHISTLDREVIYTMVSQHAGVQPKVTPSPPAATFPVAPRPASGRAR